MSTNTVKLNPAYNVSVNSKRDHPPPRATPGHLSPVQLHIVGHLTRIGSPTHRAFDPSKKCWSSVAREKDFVLHVTSHNSSWFSTKFMLIHLIQKRLFWALAIGHWEAIVRRSLKQSIHCFRMPKQ